MFVHRLGKSVQRVKIATVLLLKIQNRLILVFEMYRVNDANTIVRVHKYARKNFKPFLTISYDFITFYASNKTYKFNDLKKKNLVKIKRIQFQLLLLFEDIYLIINL